MDVDADAIADCRDTCLDRDGDGYGLAGGGGNTCTGPDCNDFVGTCNVDCATDVDSDGTPDCQDGCLDADGDGFGLPGGVGNTCTGPDCDDTVATCAVDCVTDTDADSVADCADTCLDPDGDGYGAAGTAGNTCTGADCDETVASCNTDCVTDVDADATPDCRDGCVDADGDGYGTAGGGTNTCTGPDCDDTAMTCNLDCTTDVDGDSVPDCEDSCLDADSDGFGAPGGLGNTCTAADCDDTRAACTNDCQACLPGFLALSTQTPVAACGVSTLTIDLAGYDNAVPELSCMSTSELVFGVTRFQIGREQWTSFSDANDVEITGWPGGFPTPSCSSGTTGDFIRFNDGAASFMQLGAPLDFSGVGNLTLRVLAGYANDPPASDVLTVSACCGAGCTPAPVTTIANDNVTPGGDNCAQRIIALPSTLDDCGALMVRFDWPNSSADAGVDDISIRGEVLFAPIAETTPGTYTTAVSSCPAVSYVTTCRWDDGTNPPRSDAQPVAFQ